MKMMKLMMMFFDCCDFDSISETIWTSADAKNLAMMKMMMKLGFWDSGTKLQESGFLGV